MDKECRQCGYYPIIEVTWNTYRCPKCSAVAKGESSLSIDMHMEIGRMFERKLREERRVRSEK